jgi:hypothetical protein
MSRIAFFEVKKLDSHFLNPSLFFLGAISHRGGGQGWWWKEKKNEMLPRTAPNQQR